jgi:hypothetical protein
MDAAPERRWKKDIVRSFRLNRDLLNSMEAECRARHISLSECVRQALVTFMRLGRGRGRRYERGVRV